jgi:hypothetical protein
MLRISLTIIYFIINIQICHSQIHYLTAGNTSTITYYLDEHQLTDQNIDSIFEISKEISCNLIYCETEDKLTLPLKYDFFNYFRFHSLYNTPLKEKMFKSSDESKIYKDSIVAIRRNELNNWHKISIGNDGNYDIDKGYFLIRVRNQYSETVSNYEPEIMGIYFQDLKSKLLYEPPFLYMKFRIDEKNALIIENNLDDIQFYFVFKVKKDLFKKSLKGEDDYRWLELPSAYNIKFIIYNAKKNEIMARVQIH